MAGFPKGDKRVGVKARKPSNGVRISDALIIEALQKTRGNIARAADKIGVSRTCLYSRINRDPALKEHMQEYRQRFLDDAEDVLQGKVLAGDTSSLFFALKHLARDRGYDQDRDVIAESATRGALEFIFNQSKNPAE